MPHATAVAPPPSLATWLVLVDEIGPTLAAQGTARDLDGDFVAANFELLREKRFFSAGVPADLGGGGATHAELAQILRAIGRHCGSTALALSMHTHLIAAAVWRHEHGQPAEKLLRRVAAEELVLVSTGASDWLGSNGALTPVEGGYRYSATKICCSGSPAGHVLVTSGALADGPEGPEVLHFAVPFSAEGVKVVEDWDVLGMRGTGSHTVCLTDVFVPEDAIALRRPAEGWHPAWSVVLTVAMPLILSAYLGVADRAYDIARGFAVRKGPGQPLGPLGQLENQYVAAQLAVESMVSLAADYDFSPDVKRANATLVRKSLATNALIALADTAMEAGGGAMFARRVGFERCFRDLQGCRFHPLAESRQLEFSAKLALGLDPVV